MGSFCVLFDHSGGSTLLLGRAWVGVARALSLMINTENSKRVVTAVVMVGVAVTAILSLDSSLFSLGVGLIAAGAAWEWSRLCRKTVGMGRDIAFIALIGAGVPGFLAMPIALPWILCVAVFWWLGVAFLLMYWGRKARAPSWEIKRWHGLLAIVPAAVAIVGLHGSDSEGRWYVLACLLIVWTTDTAAYIVGRICGKTLLAPKISPAKTVEGSVGGLVGASIVGLILYEVLPTEILFSRLDWMALIVVTAIFSVIGDLAESSYKRTAGVKDSGWILPGHGGILDRIDSTLASSPIFVAGMILPAG